MKNLIDLSRNSYRLFPSRTTLVPYTSFHERNFDMMIRREKGLLETIDIGNILIVVGLASTASAVWCVFDGKMPMGLYLFGVGAIVNLAGNAVISAKERMTNSIVEYNERERQQEIWRQIGDMEDRMSELEAKKTR